MNIMDMIDTFDSGVAMESFGDVTEFIRDPKLYLDNSRKEHSTEAMYTADLDTNGRVYTTVVKACDELVKVNAYQEAIKIYTTIIDHMEYTKKNNPEVTKDDEENLNWAISELQNKMMNTCKLRDEYTSKRKSVLAKYSLMYAD